MWWSILAPVLFLAGPVGSDLALDGLRQQAFVREHAPALLRVRFHAPLREGQDPRFQSLEESYAVAIGDAKDRVILAPSHRLKGVKRAELWLWSGDQIAVRVEESPTPAEVPFARLVPEAPVASDRLKTLPWAPDDIVSAGQRGWLIESPLNGGELRGKAAPVLAQAVVGDAVEHPLERFRYVSARRADGLPVLDDRGRVLCVVFRTVPGIDGTSLCAPRKAAMSRRYERPDFLVPRTSP